MRYVSHKKSETVLGYSLGLEASEIPENLSDNDVLIKVAAAGVNRADLYQAEGKYRPPAGASQILGLEVSGEIVKIGKNVKSQAVGSKVCALLQGGGYAEYVSVPEWRVLSVPKNIDLIHAAGIPEVFFTAYLNLFELANLKPSETVLIHGGASGVGTAAIQIASQFGAKVITTAGSDEKCRLCEKLGASLAINYKKQDFLEKITEFTGGNGVNVILDMVGGSYLQRNLKVLANRGHMVIIGFIESNVAEVNLAPVLLKNLTIKGSTLRSQSEEDIYNLVQSIRNNIWPLFESGKISPVIDSIFKFDEAMKAHEKMRGFAHSGKILLVP